MAPGWISNLSFGFFRVFFLCSFLISNLVAHAVDPYLLPETHPIKPLLDVLFTSSRALFNCKELEKAGFKRTRPRRYTQILVTTHPAVPGYIFKLYLDVQRYHKDKPESHFWILRCKGAEKVRNAIEDHQLSHLFKVPQKWIYELPKKPRPHPGYYPKAYILVEEDMEILCGNENKNRWASDFVTHEMLSGLFDIVNEVGLQDALKPDNIPFSQDGRIAFVDTQTFNQKVNFNRLKRFLSRENKKTWEILIKEK